MSQQLSMFDIFEPPPALIIERVDPCGEVVRGQADETLTLPRKGNANPIAEIELHQHINGRWMWSTSHHLSNGSGGCYKVGPKWGKFAATRSDALRAAVDELIDHLGKREACRDIAPAIAWARTLT